MKNLEIALLLDFYETLLTPKQRRLLDLYYNNDYSLSEIAQLEGVSRQAVLDNIKRGEGALLGFEQKLRLSERYQKTVQAARTGVQSAGEGSKEGTLFNEILNIWEDNDGV